MNSDINKYKSMATGYTIKRELTRLQRLNLKCLWFESFAVRQSKFTYVSLLFYCIHRIMDFTIMIFHRSRYANGSIFLQGDVFFVEGVIGWTHTYCFSCF